MPDSTPIRAGFVALPPMFQCDRWRAKLTVLSCAAKYRAAQGVDAAARQHTNCVGCPIGPEHGKLAAKGLVEPTQAAVMASDSPAVRRVFEVVRTPQEHPESAGDAGAPVFEPVQTLDPLGIPVLRAHVDGENAPAVHEPSNEKNGPASEPTDPQATGQKPLALVPVAEEDGDGWPLRKDGLRRAEQHECERPSCGVAFWRRDAVARFCLRHRPRTITCERLGCRAVVEATSNNQRFCPPCGEAHFKEAKRAIDRGTMKRHRKNMRDLHAEVRALRSGGRTNAELLAERDVLDARVRAADREIERMRADVAFAVAKQEEAETKLAEERRTADDAYGRIDILATEISETNARLAEAAKPDPDDTPPTWITVLRALGLRAQWVATSFDVEGRAVVLCRVDPAPSTYRLPCGWTANVIAIAKAIGHEVVCCEEAADAGNGRMIGISVPMDSNETWCT